MTKLKLKKGWKIKRGYKLSDKGRKAIIQAQKRRWKIRDWPRRHNRIV